MNFNCFLGVDVSKLKLDFADSKNHLRGQVENSRDGVAKLIQRLPEPQSVLIVLEATGGYEKTLVNQLLDAGHLVALVNPRKVRAFAIGIGILAKTDAIDALVIANFGEKVRPRTLAQKHEKQDDLDQLVTRRRQLVELRKAENCRLQNVVHKAVRKSLLQTIKLFDKQILALEKEMTTLIESDDEWNDKAQLLSSVPGVGDVTARTLIAEVPELGQLNRQEIAALIGVAPFNRDSGKFKGKRTIFGGRAGVRSALYMAAVTAASHNPVIKAFYDRLKSQGKACNTIRIACARKLLVILNTMVKNNSHWNPHPSCQNA